MGTSGAQLCSLKKGGAGIQRHLFLYYYLGVFSWHPRPAANLMGGRPCVSRAEVTSHSAPRSAGGSRSRWTRRWSGRRAPPRRWRRGLHPPRTWSPRRGLPRPGLGQSSPANTVMKKKLTNELAFVLPLPKTKRSDQIPSYHHQELPLQLRIWVCVFCLNPLRHWWRRDLLSVRLSVPARLPVLQLMMYRDGRRGERAGV